MNKKSLFFVCFAFLGYSCVSIHDIAPPISEAFLQARPHAEKARLDIGRQLYIRRCASCHSLDPVDAYDETEWDEVFSTMAKKSKLVGSEESDIRFYISEATIFLHEQRAQAEKIKKQLEQ